VFFSEHSVVVVVAVVVNILSYRYVGTFMVNSMTSKNFSRSAVMSRTQTICLWETLLTVAFTASKPSYYY